MGRPNSLTWKRQVPGFRETVVLAASFWALAAMFEPMAVVIMFGRLFATALTLGFVPLLYSIFFGVNFKEHTAPT